MRKIGKKGQAGVGMLILGAIAVIVALVLFQASADNVEKGTRTNTGLVTVNNATYTMAAAVNGITEVAGQELVGSVGLTNKTAGQTQIQASNYSVAECVRTSDGLKGICLKVLDDDYASANVNITYTYYPDGYIDDAGGRAVAGIIILLAAIAIGITLLPIIRNKYD